MERNSAMALRAFRVTLALSSLLVLIAAVDPAGLRGAFL
jgi:hypothetical protein